MIFNRFMVCPLFLKSNLIVLSILFCSTTGFSQNNFPLTGNVGINLGSSTSQNKLQIGSNPQGWSGNDLVISGDNTKGAVAISSDASHSFIYGDRDVAIRPGFGKWSLYAKGTTGYVGIGFTNPTAMLHVQQSSNTDWAAFISNDGGSGKGLRIKGAAGDAPIPLLQIEDNLENKRLVVLTNGLVGIGTANPDQKLTVKGTIHTEEVRVDMTVPGPDYVFEKNYNLLPLSELETYITQNKHLPEVPSAKEMEAEGLNLKEMNLILLKKVEELTLHLIEMKKENKLQQWEIENLKREIKK
jgi:hypothetical protein